MTPALRRTIMSAPEFAAVQPKHVKPASDALSSKASSGGQGEAKSSDAGSEELKQQQEKEQAAVVKPKEAPALTSQQLTNSALLLELQRAFQSLQASQARAYDPSTLVDACSGLGLQYPVLHQVAPIPTQCCAWSRSVSTHSRPCVCTVALPLHTPRPITERCCGVLQQARGTVGEAAGSLQAPRWRPGCRVWWPHCNSLHPQLLRLLESACGGIHCPRDEHQGEVERRGVSGCCSACRGKQRGLP